MKNLKNLLPEFKGLKRRVIAHKAYIIALTERIEALEAIPSSLGAGNGLTENAGNIDLGGLLENNVLIDVTDNDFNFDTDGTGGYVYYGGNNGIDTFGIYARYTAIQNSEEIFLSATDGNEGGSLTIDLTETVYRDLRTIETGIKYYADYSATFVDASLVSKKYVDDAIVTAIAAIP